MYGEVPPETLEVNCCDWPRSIVTERGDMVTENALLTATVAVFDVAANPTLSVTFT